MTCTRCGSSPCLARCRGPVTIRPVRAYASLAAAGPRVAGERREVRDGAGVASAFTDGTSVYGREVTRETERAA